MYDCSIILEQKKDDDDEYKSPESKAFLDAIAGSESPGYNVIVGGSRFKDTTKHPGEVNPNLYKKTGYNSDASGRYQFLSTTYRPIADRLGLKDFSARSQDRAAWQNAKDNYRGNLKADLRKDPVGVARALSGQWTSLPGGKEKNDATDSYEQRFRTQLSKYDERKTQPSASTPTQAPKPSAITPPPSKTFTKKVIDDKGGKGGKVTTHTAYKTKLGGKEATSTRGDSGNQVIRANLGKTSKPVKDQKVSGILGGQKGTIEIKGGNKTFTAATPPKK
jgi:muramidase (phage lysozyme)